MIILTVTENEANQRIDRFLKKYLRQAPLSVIYKILRKDVRINGKRPKEGYILLPDDEIALYISREELDRLTRCRERPAAKRQFGIAYEDDSVLIVEKPWGLLTHGDSFEKKNTLANQVCGYLQDKGQYDPAEAKTFTPSPVNRLDRNTTGLVIFGKTGESLRTLTEIIRKREEIKKYYMTIVSGSFTEELLLEGNIIKDRDRNRVKVTDRDGKTAVTSVKPIVSRELYSLVEVQLITGRTHQIRAHLAKWGFPLIGDVKYGSKQVNDNVKRQFGLTTQLLHASRLEFGRMPGALKALENRVVMAKMPRDFKTIMKGLNLCKEE